jgi:hypothetical protein
MPGTGRLAGLCQIGRVALGVGGDAGKHVLARMLAAVSQHQVGQIVVAPVVVLVVHVMAWRDGAVFVAPNATVQ